MASSALSRWRPFLILAVAVLAIVVAPANNDDDRDEAASAAAAAGGDTATAVTVPAGSGPNEAGAAAAAAAVTGANPRGGVRIGSNLPTAPPSAPAATGAGIGTPAALAAPDCDAAVGRLKISFTWRPACVVPWSDGANNGGATHQGVTATTIKVVRYNDPPLQKDSDELKAQWQTSIDLYHHFYRMWGRKVENIVVDKSGDDEVAQRADAIRIANMKPFAAIGIPSTDPVLVTELATRGVVVVSNSNIPVKLSLDLAPYVWGVTIQSDEHVALNAGEYAGKRLLGKPAKWAGQADYQVTTRKFGLVHPDTWDLSIFNGAFGKYGGKLTDAISYQSGQAYASTWGERSGVIAARLKDRGVTTVIAGTDLLFTGPLTHAAATQNYFPEWVLTGYLAQDLDIVASTFNQAEWRNAFGPTGIPIAGKQPWPQYWFYDWYWGEGYAEDHQDGPAHSEATVLFAGIHGAGPNLTPQTFRDGVFSLPPAGGPATGGIQSAQHSFGRWGFFPWDDYNAFDDFDESYWDTTAVAPDLVTGQNTAGHYRHLNGGKRYLVSQWPAGEPNMFNPAGTAVFYESYPPGDMPPSYPCVGCPSTAA